MNKDYENYRHRVIHMLEYWADGSPEDLMTQAAIDMLPEVIRESHYTKEPFRGDWPARAAARAALFCSDVWDEDYAIKNQNKLQEQNT